MGDSSAETVNQTKRWIQDANTVGLRLIDGRLSEVHKRRLTLDLYVCKMDTGQNNPKMAVWGQNHPLKGKFSKFLD